MSKSMTISKKNLISQEEMIRELLAWNAVAMRDMASYAKNRNWYRERNVECKAIASQFYLTLHQVCQSTSAISPGKDWTVNIRDEIWLIEAWLQYDTLEERKAYLSSKGFMVGYTWENVIKGFKCLDGIDILPTSPKTYNFAWDLEFPESTPEEDGDHTCTIDLHMAHILCRTGAKGSVNPSMYYQYMAYALCFVAVLLGMLPRELQAALWAFRVEAFAAGVKVESLCALIASIQEAELYV